jgi:glucose/mannose-6-phosphate isomerase
MLDDLKYINQKDPAATLEIARQEFLQLKHDFKFSDKTNQKITNIVFCGMGGSALAALISQSWPGYYIPFEVVRNYYLPNYVNKRTLVIISSYSGNTEETLSALEDALKRMAQIVIISSGGKLLRIANDEKLPMIRIPGGLQPRYSVYYNLVALLEILVNYNLAPPEKLQELHDSATFLQNVASQWEAEIPTKHNLAKRIALETSGKSVVIYGGPITAPAAYKWKISFNENAKQVAWWNQFSEYNHNEFIGWSKQPILKPYCLIELRSKYEHPRILKRFIISDKLLSGLRPNPIVVDLKGESILENLLYGITLGDFSSLYSAILGGVNPEPVKLIERLKKELA